MSIANIFKWILCITITSQHNFFTYSNRYSNRSLAYSQSGCSFSTPSKHSTVLATLSFSLQSPHSKLSREKYADESLWLHWMALM